MDEEKKQLNIILLIVFIGFMGASLPYTIFAPLFLNNTNSLALIPPSWDLNYRGFMLGVALATYPFGQFFGAPIIGGLSDRYGRKFILIISLSLSSLGHLFSAIALTLHSLPLLLFSRFFTGLMEGNIAIVQSMAGDFKHIRKEVSFGKIFAIGSVGYILGPLIGGIISDKNIFKYFSYDLPFYLAALIAVVTMLLAATQLTIFQQHTNDVPFLQRFNFHKRMKILFSKRKLKDLLIVSIIFTFSIDIFYEFGPVYLTILWGMSPAKLALYNTMLCIGLSLGSIDQARLAFVDVRKIVLISMLITASTFLSLVLFQDVFLALVLFFIAGIGIAITSNRLNVQVSNNANKDIHGETIGNQFGLRMLGDSIICLIGGLMIAKNAILPLLFSAVIAIVAFIFYQRCSKNLKNF